MTEPHTTFLAKARTKQLTLAVIGLGYVGLPLAGTSSNTTSFTSRSKVSGWT